MEEHHWGGQGWNPAVEPEEEEEEFSPYCKENTTLHHYKDQLHNAV
jgi:hypothetical protein